MNDIIQSEIEQPVTMVFRRFDPVENGRIADVLSERLVTQLWDTNGRLEILDHGKMVPVTHSLMQALIGRHFRTPQLAWRGGKAEVYLTPVDAPRTALGDIIQMLQKRVAQAPQAPRELSYQHWQEISDRLRSGEHPQPLATAYQLPLTRVVEIRDANRA
jgi:hypothetical protein